MMQYWWTVCVYAYLLDLERNPGLPCTMPLPSPMKTTVLTTSLWLPSSRRRICKTQHITSCTPHMGIHTYTHTHIQYIQKVRINLEVFLKKKNSGKTKLNVKWRKKKSKTYSVVWNLEFDTSIFLSKSTIRLYCSIRAYFALLKLLMTGDTNLCCTRAMTLVCTRLSVCRQGQRPTSLNF